MKTGKPHFGPEAFQSLHLPTLADAIKPLIPGAIPFPEPDKRTGEVSLDEILAPHNLGDLRKRAALLATLGSSEAQIASIRRLLVDATPNTIAALYVSTPTEMVARFQAQLLARVGRAVIGYGHRPFLEPHKFEKPELGQHPQGINFSTARLHDIDGIHKVRFYPPELLQNVDQANTFLAQLGTSLSLLTDTKKHGEEARFSCVTGVTDTESDRGEFRVTIDVPRSWQNQGDAPLSRVDVNVVSSQFRYTLLRALGEGFSFT